MADPESSLKSALSTVSVHANSVWWHEGQDSYRLANLSLWLNYLRSKAPQPAVDDHVDQAESSAPRVSWSPLPLEEVEYPEAQDADPGAWLRGHAWPTAIAKNFPAISAALSSSDRPSLYQYSRVLEKMHEANKPYKIETLAEMKLYRKTSKESIKKIWSKVEPTTRRKDPSLNANVPGFYPSVLFHHVDYPQPYPPITDHTGAWKHMELFPYHEQNTEQDGHCHVPPVYPTTSPENFVERKTWIDPCCFADLRLLQKALKSGFIGGSHSRPGISQQHGPLQQRHPFQVFIGPNPQQQQQQQVHQHQQILFNTDFPELPPLRGNDPSAHVRRHSGFPDICTFTEKTAEEMVELHTWLQAAYPERAAGFAEMAAVLNAFEEMARRTSDLPHEEVTNLENFHSLPSSSTGREEADLIPEIHVYQEPRRLYRDVLVSKGEDDSETTLEGKFEELEREALEQYISSENSGDVVETEEPSADVEDPYQDLERQAVEQYEYHGEIEDTPAIRIKSSRKTLSSSPISLLTSADGCEAISFSDNSPTHDEDPLFRKLENTEQNRERTFSPTQGGVSESGKITNTSETTTGLSKEGFTVASVLSRDESQQHDKPKEIANTSNPGQPIYTTLSTVRSTHSLKRQGDTEIRSSENVDLETSSHAKHSGGVVKDSATAKRRSREWRNKKGRRHPETVSTIPERGSLIWRPTGVEMLSDFNPVLPIDAGTLRSKTVRTSAGHRSFRSSPAEETLSELNPVLPSDAASSSSGTVNTNPALESIRSSPNGTDTHPEPNPVFQIDAISHRFNHEQCNQDRSRLVFDGQNVCRREREHINSSHFLVEKQPIAEDGREKGTGGRKPTINFRQSTCQTSQLYRSAIKEFKSQKQAQKRNVNLKYPPLNQFCRDSDAKAVISSLKIRALNYLKDVEKKPLNEEKNAIRVLLYGSEKEKIREQVTVEAIQNTDIFKAYVKEIAGLARQHMEGIYKRVRNDVLEMKILHISQPTSAEKRKVRYLIKKCVNLQKKGEHLINEKKCPKKSLEPTRKEINDILNNIHKNMEVVYKLRSFCREARDELDQKKIKRCMLSEIVSGDTLLEDQPDTIRHKLQCDYRSLLIYLLCPKAGSVLFDRILKRLESVDEMYAQPIDLTINNYLLSNERFYSEDLFTGTQSRFINCLSAERRAWSELSDPKSWTRVLLVKDLLFPVILHVEPGRAQIHVKDVKETMEDLEKRLHLREHCGSCAQDSKSKFPGPEKTSSVMERCTYL